MCEICLRSPCLSGCPNEIIPTIGTCSHCKNDIVHGMEYMDYDGDYICGECIDNMSTSELVSLFGYEIRTAGDED